MTIDVEILHQIITRAAEHPEVDKLPFRAIFAEYDAVLAENGIQSGKDQTYLRFLFQLGDKELRGDDLYSRFEILMRHIGIQLDYGGDMGIEEQLEYEPHDDSFEHRDADFHLNVPNGINPEHHRPRRASFNSIYDATADLTDNINNRPSSRTSLSRLEVGTGGLLEPHDGRESHPRVINHHKPNSANIRPSIETIGLPVYNDDGAYFKQNLERPTNGQQLATQNGHAEPYPTPADHDDSTDSGTSNDDLPPIEVPPEMFYQPSLSHLLHDASVFNMYKERRFFRGILNKWSDQAVRQRNAFEAMRQIAVNHDARTLLRQALDIWQGAIHKKRQVVQTERFFKHLEKRAARARDLYLLTKAFTHWSHVASEEVEKTANARRHVICMKYFNAWREITAVNELKAQRLAFKKPLKLWKARHQRNLQDEAKADEFYRENLIRRSYWRWFWTFCDKQAPGWNEHRLKQRSLISWLRAFRTQRERDHEIDTSRKRNLVTSVFQKWSQRSIAITAAQEEADKKWTNRVTGEHLMEWRIQHRLERPYIVVRKMVETRLVRSAANTWALRTRMERKAREVDRLRIMRNAWTAWNDRLRCQALHARIQERLVMQGLYKWVLMERLCLMTRINQQRLKGDMLQRLTANSQGLYSQLLRREEGFRAHRARELLRAKFDHWREQLANQRRRNQVALTFYAPRVESESLNGWRSRLQHIKTTEGWAKDARYFFLTMKTIKQWQVATVEASKKRRLDAYTTVRRKIKMNMAADALFTWRSRTAVVRDSERKATEVYGTKLISRGIGMLHLWSQKATERQQNFSDAEIYHNRQLVYNHLSYWLELHRAHKANEEKALRFLEIHLSSVALTQFRKLSLRIFRVRTQMETGEALNERNARKHYRNMFHHWRERARASRQTRMAPTPLTAGPLTELFGTEDDWQESEPTFENQEPIRQPDFTSYTPSSTPGYLSSPSKRAARAKALFQASATPVTPLSSAVPRRLFAASEPRMAPAYSTQTAYRRSALSNNVRFAIEEEPESPTEGKSSNRIT